MDSYSYSYSLLFFFLALSISSHAKLTPTYYDKTCPQFAEIVREAAMDKQTISSSTAAGTVRVFFHDCIVSGCDASVLVSSTGFVKSERDAEDNVNLPGDAFDVISRAKTTLELTCPGVVSCADILAQVTRDLIKIVGGPFYQVRLGRKDSLVSNIADVAGKVPKGGMNMDQIIDLFKAKGFSVQEIVALIGSHTIGFSHCKEFAQRLYPVDPAMHPEYANRLKTLCTNYQANPSMAAYNDVITPAQFDNKYYQNMKKGLSLLPIDQMVHMDPRTRGFAERYAANQTEFFDAFAKAMEKLSRLEVKIGSQGEVRHKCNAFNSVTH